ncbi:nuclear transport factor 2 family protein [Niveispirillum sp. KHB5.9]|uniref:nuclear transport factor 2 family protein n=1 Tax=Niveispirillum sp. KHB5.9 TaxID=3400269 RepID=UPI003A8C7035
MDANLTLIRRYVTDFVNRHDFSVITQIMAADYTLDTGGLLIAGRDDAYRSAVARQLQQFPGLVFTPHEVMHAGDHIALRFTEHGASYRHGGQPAAWESIGIYRLRDGRMAGCAIEQDYFSRRRQLEEGQPMPVDHAAIAPWDSTHEPPSPTAEALARDWLASGRWTDQPGVEIDDQRATGRCDRIIAQSSIDITTLVSAGNRVAFHAVQRGELAMDFSDGKVGIPAWMHCAGIITLQDGTVKAGHVLRDRWGLWRRLARQK